MQNRWLPARKEGTWKVRCYTVGRTVEKIKFRVPDKITNNREKTRREIARQERTGQHGVRAICRTVNANFYRRDGYLLELTYSDEAVEKLEARVRAAGEEVSEDTIRKAAEKEMQLWLRRVRRACATGGARYWAVTSDRNGKKNTPVRVHHHVIVGPEMVDVCRAKWKMGLVKAEQLWDEPDHNALVTYLLQQVRCKTDEKRYTPSRNLVHPAPDYERTVHSDAELRVPAGCSLLERAENSRIEPQYIRYYKPFTLSEGEDCEKTDKELGRARREVPILPQDDAAGGSLRGL